MWTLHLKRIMLHVAKRSETYDQRDWCWSKTDKMCQRILASK